MIRPAKNGMNLKFARLVAALAVLGSTTALAAAQTGTSGARSPVAPNTSATAASSGPAASVAAEPAELAGMLAAQNEARKRAGVPTLAWSPELAARADATAKAAGKGSCSINAAERTAKAANATFHWAAGMPRIAGGESLQDLSAAYIVSRWVEGRPDYDVAKGLCRSKSPKCEAYARMVAPAARWVGCARNICSNQAQVWICLYSDQPAR